MLHKEAKVKRAIPHIGKSISSDKDQIFHETLIIFYKFVHFMPLFFIYTDFLKAHNVSVNKQHMNLNIPMKTFSNHLSK